MIYQCLVEGKTEVLALPQLLRLALGKYRNHWFSKIPEPVLFKRHKILKTGELERACELALIRAQTLGSASNIAIVFLLDADEEIQRDLSNQVELRLRQTLGPRGFQFCRGVAKHEFEAWILAAIHTHPKHQNLSEHHHPEAPKSPKEILTKIAEYSIERAAAYLTEIDLNVARARSPSCKEFIRSFLNLHGTNITN